jgi:hypothetical protein
VGFVYSISFASFQKDCIFRERHHASSDKYHIYQLFLLGLSRGFTGGLDWGNAIAGYLVGTSDGYNRSSVAKRETEDSLDPTPSHTRGKARLSFSGCRDQATVPKTELSLYCTS